MIFSLFVFCFLLHTKRKQQVMKIHLGVRVELVKINDSAVWNVQTVFIMVVVFVLVILLSWMAFKDIVIDDEEQTFIALSV